MFVIGLAILAAISPWHIALLLGIILLMFGGKKLPELARGLARGMRIFRDEMHGMQREVDDVAKSADTPLEPTKERDIHADTKAITTQPDLAQKK